MSPRYAVLAILLLLAPLSRAAEVTVVAAEARPEAAGSWRFSVPLEHADSGWDHYADRWEVLAPDGTVLGQRVLYHPHVDEQPFTRSLGGVQIPPSLDRVLIRGHDSRHGYGPAPLEIELPR